MQHGLKVKNTRIANAGIAAIRTAPIDTPLPQIVDLEGHKKGEGAKNAGDEDVEGKCRPNIVRKRQNDFFSQVLKVR